MADERLSLQDLVRIRQQSSFVGRQEQLSYYRENLSIPANSEGHRFIFNIHGDAGVGKTYLVQLLQQIATESGAVTAYIDDRVDNIVNVMSTIARELGQGGLRLRELEKRIAAYGKRRSQLESDPQAPDGVASFVTKTAVVLGLSALRGVPFAGGLTDAVSPVSTAEQIDRARVYLERKFRNQADVKLLLSPADELTPIFVQNLIRRHNKRPIALFFDSYERTASLLDPWLHDLYDGRYGKLPAELVTTISGQRPLRLNTWSDLVQVIADVPLEPFSEAEAHQFLRSKGISDEPTIRVISSLSGRLPMWLVTLAEARPQDSAEIGDPAGEAVDRFLKWENDPVRRGAAISAALPRTVNQDVLGIIAPTGEASDLFDWLCSLPFVSSPPFVSSQSGTWRYHEVVRTAMLRLQQARSPEQWRTAHASLAQANKRWADETAGGSGRTWSNSGWVRYTREQIYHLVCEDPINNLPKALASAVKAAESGQVYARQWAELLIDAGHDSNQAELYDWGVRLRDGIHDEDLSEYLTFLIDDAELDPTALNIALEERGEIYRLTGSFEKALADFTRAIEIRPDNVWAIGSRGQTHRAMGQYAEALADFARAIDIDPDRAWIIADRGETYRLMGRYEQAVTDFSRAVDLNPDRAWAIASRGETYHAMGRYEQAVTDFSRAVDLNPDWAWAIASRGESYHAMGRYEQAVTDFSRAVDLDPDWAWAVARRGLAQMTLGRHAEALANFSQAIGIDTEYAEVFAVRGLLYTAMCHYDEAIADLTRASSLDPDADWGKMKDAVELLNAGRLDEVVDVLTEAVQSNPDSILAFGLRGTINLAMGRGDAATADFSHTIELQADISAHGVEALADEAANTFDDAIQAWTYNIELNPSSAAARIFRAQVYQKMGREDDALADLTHAIDLIPGSAWPVTVRGMIYEELERHDDALADLTHAIDLDPRFFPAFIYRTLTNISLNQYDDALDDLSRLTDICPKVARFVGLRAIVLQELGRDNEALTDFSHAVDLDPDYAEAIASRADIYRDTGRYDQALEDFSHLIDLDYENVEAFAGRGETYRLMGRCEEALADFTRAIELDPDSAWAIGSRGQTYQAMGRYEEALADLSRAVDLNPDWAWAIASRGETHRLMGRCEEALADLTRAIELNPESDDFYQRRAEILRSMGRHDEALVDFTSALNLFNRLIEAAPEDASHHFNKGYLLFGLDRAEEATLEFLEVIRLRPHDVLGARVLLGVVAWPSDQEGARQHFADSLSSPGAALTPWTRALFRAIAIAGLGRADDAVPELEAALPLRSADDTILDLATERMLRRLENPPLPGLAALRRLNERFHPQ